jgi:hypothetical protein
MKNPFEIYCGKNEKLFLFLLWFEKEKKQNNDKVFERCENLVVENQDNLVKQITEVHLPNREEKFGVCNNFIVTESESYEV